MKTLIGIDVGTTSLKVIVLDENCQILASSKNKYSMIVNNQTEVQIDGMSLWKTILKCFKEISYNNNKEYLQNAVGVGISSLCPGLVAFDRSGNLIVDPIIYSDRRSIEEAEEILSKVGKDKLFDITANGSMAGAFSGSTMLWIKNNLKDIYKNTATFGHINTFIGYKMTGKYGIDYSNASYSNLFETTKNKVWSEQLCDLIGIDIEKMAPLMEASNVVGELNNIELIEIGLKKGTPVVIGGADTPCSTLATGTINHGDLCESAGTTNVLTVCTEKPEFDPRFINRCHVVPNKWIYQGAMSFTGAANEWFIRNMVMGLMKEELTYEEALLAFNVEAADSVAGSNGVIFLPYLLGERSPIWDPYARSVFFGVSITTKRKDMARAILEACGYGLRQMIEIAEDRLNQKYDRFLSIGGGSRSEIWSQIKADITGKEVIVSENADYAPIGAAMLAGIGSGVFKDENEAASACNIKVLKRYLPNHNNDEVYTKRFGVYKNLYPALKNLYKENFD